MPSIPREGLPEFWTTRIAKVLVGDQPCLREAWMQGHYKIEKRVRDDGSSLALWKANHTKLLHEVVERYSLNDWQCSVERFFKVKGQTAILTGKTDLIVQKPNCRPKIVDVKSGEPRESDLAQVMIEIIAIPLAWESPMTFEGEVVYPTHTVPVSHADAMALKPKVFAMLKHLGVSRKLDARPSQSACRFCDLNDTDCPDRWSEVELPAATVEF